MRVTAVGDCGIDRYVDVRADRPGGISLNFAANARRCFEPDDTVGVLTVLGDDREAGLVEAAIGTQGLDLQIVHNSGQTPIQFIDRDEAGERHFVRYDAGVLAEHRMNSADRELLARSDVMIATVFTQIIDYFETVARTSSAGLRALDYCNAGTQDDPLAYVRRFTQGFDVGFVGLGEASGDQLDQIEAIARDAGKIIVVTLGARGSVGLSRESRVQCTPMPSVDVVDTTGAGDTFAAGFLSVFARGGPLAAALVAGTREASRTVGHMGAFEAELTPWPANAPAAWSALRSGD